MRRKVTVPALQKFMQELAAAARSSGKVYLTGGATALLLGFRDQTIDIDIRLDPEPAGAFEAIARLKNLLDINVELASPMDFIPATPDWRAHSRHIASIGPVEFYHFDLELQALSKLERGHEQDLDDVGNLLRRGLVSAVGLKQTLELIEPMLVRYPAVDAHSFKAKVAAFLTKWNP